MENFLALAALVILVWWYIEKRVSKLHKPIQYTCLFEKAIFTSEPEDKQSAGVLFSGGKEAELEKQIILPFLPQLGMTVSDFPDVMSFSEKIQEINWNNLHHTFHCKIAPYFMNSDDSLGHIILNYLNQGWKLKNKHSRIVVAMNKVITEWEEEIIKMESKKNETLKVDRDLLEKAKVLFQENS